MSSFQMDDLIRREQVPLLPSPSLAANQPRRNSRTRCDCCRSNFARGPRPPVTVHAAAARHDEQIEIAVRLQVAVRDAARQRDQARERQRADQAQQACVALEERAAARFAPAPLGDLIVAFAGKKKPSR